MGKVSALRGAQSSSKRGPRCPSAGPMSCASRRLCWAKGCEDVRLVGIEAIAVEGMVGRTNLPIEARALSDRDHQTGADEELGVRRAFGPCAAAALADHDRSNSPMRKKAWEGRMHSHWRGTAARDTLCALQKLALFLPLKPIQRFGVAALQSHIDWQIMNTIWDRTRHSVRLDQKHEAPERSLGRS